MITTLPTVKQTWDESTEKVITDKGTMTVHIDTSFRAYMKWDKNFKEQEGCDLTTFSELMKVKTKELQKDPSKINAKVMDGVLKVLYCFLDEHDLPSYDDFLGILDLSTMTEIVEKLAKILSQVGISAGKN